MARFDDFDFENDDPGPDTDPVPDRFDEDIPIEYYDEANYDEPGADIGFPGDSVSVWDGVGNAENPTEQLDHQAPVVSERNDDAYWREQVDIMREEKYARAERDAIQKEYELSDAQYQKIRDGLYGVPASAYGQYVPFDFEPPETANMDPATRGKVFAVMEDLRSKAQSLNRLEQLGFYGYVPKPKESGTEEDDPEPQEPVAKVITNNPFSEGSAPTLQEMRAELAAGEAEATSFGTGKGSKAKKDLTLLERIEKLVADELAQPHDPDPTGMRSWILRSFESEMVAEALRRADKDPTGMRSWINKAFASELAAEQALRDDPDPTSLGAWIAERELLGAFPDAVIDPDPTGLRNWINRNLTDLIEEEFNAQQKLANDPDPTGLTTWIADVVGKGYHSETDRTIGEDPTGLRSFIVRKELRKYFNTDIGPDNVFEELADFELEMWDGEV